MRARLLGMNPGQEFIFLCSHLMAEKMDKVVTGAGGEMTGRVSRGYGVVITARKIAGPAG